MKILDVATAKRRTMTPLQRVRLAETMYTRPTPTRRDMKWIGAVMLFALMVAGYSALEIACRLVGGC